jgi:branched-chain amino acid transport system permease protein
MRRPSAAFLLGAGLIAAAAVVAYAQTAQSSGPIPATIYHLCILSGISIIMAVSLNMVNGFTGQFSLGHAAFLGIGMYTGGFLADAIGPRVFAVLPGPLVVRQVVLLFILLAAGGLLSALGGLLVALPSLRLRGDYLAIVTLGFGEILRVLIQNVDALGASRGYSILHTEVYPSAEALFFWVALLVVFVVMVSRNLMLSGPGRAFLAVREDEIAAEAVGVNTYRTKVLAFVLAAVFAGFAGVLSGLYNAYMDPSMQSMGFLKSIEVVVMVVLGGLGSVTGSVLTAVVITVLPELLRAFSEYRMVAYSALLIILMLARPQGIFGTHELSFDGITRRRVRSNDPRDGGGHEPAEGGITD